MLCKVHSSDDARSAVKTNRGRRAASTVRGLDRRTVEAARRPRFVMMARRASSEDKTLWSKACRHQDSQESSGDDKMAPYRVRARAPPHRTSTPLDRSETYTPPTRPTHPSSTCRTSHVPWPGSSVRGPPQKRRPRVPRPPYRRPLSSPPRRMARPTDLRVRQPQTVLATSLGHSTP